MKHPIPDAALKETGAIIGRVGSGKTYAAKGIVERMLTDQVRTCIIDPTGVWWGLRSSADGKSPGFPIVVFGGDHADVALTEGMGLALAETLATQNLPAIIDVSEFTMAGRVRFMTAFLEKLYTLNRMPLAIIFDEADTFAPQRPGKDQLTMLGRMEQICRRGRVRGFRPWLITQRPASLHKSVLSQANTLVAMQLTSPQDRDALGDWIEGQADKTEGKRILADLPKLKKGEGWVWAPHHEILERVKFPAIATFDSSSSPEDGIAAPPLKLAAVDLSRLGKSLRKAEEELDADDPETLRARIKELEKELKQKAHDGALSAATDELALEAARREGFAQAINQVRGIADRLTTLSGAIADTVTDFVQDLSRLAPAGVPSTGPVRAEYSVTPAERKRASPAPSTSGKLGNSGKRRMLVAIAQNPDGLMFTKLSLLAGISRKGGTWRIYLKDLRDAGWVEGEEPVRITAAGLTELGPYEPLPTGAELVQWWRGRLGNSGKRMIFDTIVGAWPRAIAAPKVSEQTGIAMSGGTWRIYLKELRGLELIHGRDELKASEDLFR